MLCPMETGTSPPAPVASYGPMARGLHWVAAVLIVAAWAAIELKDVFPKGSPGRQLLGSIHAQLGLLVLLLVAIRLPWNLAFPVAEAPTPAPSWTLGAARWVKRALYLLMVAVPLSGLAASQAKGDAVSLLGYAVPDLFGSWAVLRKAFEEIHEALANTVLAVAAAHAAAALWHHFVLRDDTLARMLGGPRAPAH